MMNYKILNKTQNDKGVSFRVAKTQKVAQTLSDTVLRFFGCDVGAEVTEEFEVFYPISKHGIHFDTEMSYMDGAPVSLSLRNKIVALARIADFQETPAKTSVVVD